MVLWPVGDSFGCTLPVIALPSNWVVCCVRQVPRDLHMPVLHTLQLTAANLSLCLLQLPLPDWHAGPNQHAACEAEGSIVCANGRFVVGLCGDVSAVTPQCSNPLHATVSGKMPEDVVANIECPKTC
jgi:hypothetical protein